MLLETNKASQQYLETILEHETFINPNPLHYEFQDMAAITIARELANIGANRSGKTRNGGWLAARELIGWDPYNPTREMRLPTKGWIVTDGENVPMILEMLDLYVPPKIIRKFNTASGKWKLETIAGSKIWIKTHDQERRKFQGESLDWVWFDEEPPEKIFSEIRMRIIDRLGRIFWTLTPVDGTTWLHKRFQGLPQSKKDQLEGDFTWFSAGLADNPYIPEDVKRIEIENLRRELKGREDEFQIRVYGTYIVLGGNPVFKGKDLDWQFKNRRDPLAVGYIRQTGIMGKPYEFIPDDMGNLVIWEIPDKGDIYAIGADVAMGLKDGDFSCAQIINRRTREQSAIWHGHMDPFSFGRFLAQLGHYFNTALIVPEVNPPGNAVLDGLRASHYSHIYRRERSKGEDQRLMKSQGWWTSSTSKPQAVHTMQYSIAEREIRIHDLETLEEMRNFRKIKEGNRELSPGHHKYGCISGFDDRVMALLMAWKGHLTTPIQFTPPEEELGAWQAKLQNHHRKARIFRRRGVI